MTVAGFKSNTGPDGNVPGSCVERTRSGSVQAAQPRRRSAEIRAPVAGGAWQAAAVNTGAYRSVWALGAARRVLLLGTLVRIPLWAGNVVLTLHVVTHLGRSYGAAGLVEAKTMTKSA